MSSTTKPPCSCCNDRDITWRIAPHPTYFSTFGELVAKAVDSVCPVCRVLFTAAWIFAGNNDISPLGLYFALSSSPDRPFRLTFAEDLPGEQFTIDFITTSTLAEPFTQFKPVPLIATHSDSPQCFAQIHDWMAVCDASHGDCRTAGSVRLPTRVVDVNPTSNGLRPVLVTTKGALGQYAALSYSWGAGLPLKLTRSSLASFMSGIPWTDIPKTLQDAMTITHKLGLRYLWVDALTIIQDDEDDWHAEAAKMAMVYGNAYVTIAATHSQGLDTGIFAPRNPRYRVWPLPAQFNTKPTPVEELHDGEIYVCDSTPTSLHSHPLEKRAWALQEHILSRRVIQYTSDGLIWHCRTARATEAEPTLETSTRGVMCHLDPAVLPPRSDIDEATRNHLSKYWTRVVQNYSIRKLTRASDKLVALHGIADALSASGMGSHHAGVFESDPLAGLAWYSVDNTAVGARYSAPTHTRPTRYRAPSWSWASLDGLISWPEKFFEYPGYLGAPWAPCRVVRLSDTKLILRGKQIPGVLTRNSSVQPTRNHHETGYHMGDIGTITISGSGLDPHTDIIDTTPMHPGVAPPAGLPKLPLDVICLLLGYVTRYASYRGQATVLVLTRSSTDVEAYERVGIVYTASAQRFDGLEETEVTIV